MYNPSQEVFDNQDLRKFILTHYVRLKYKDELAQSIKLMVMDEIRELV
jgi:hypothetical protein